MKTLLQAYQDAYILALKTHFKLLTTCFTRHKGTEEAYESLFDAFHELSEKYESVSPSKEDPNTLVQGLYDVVEELKTQTNSAIASEKDEGVKNQLIQKYDDLQLVCAKLKSLIDYEEEDEKSLLKRK